MSVQYITQQTLPLCLALSKQIAQFLVRHRQMPRFWERANQLVSNTFRLLIITLRQARHQYEAGILKDAAGWSWTAVSSAQIAARLTTLLRLYLMADMALIVLISLLHFYLLYKAEAAQDQRILLRVRCQRVAYLYALFVLVPAAN